LAASICAKQKPLPRASTRISADFYLATKIATTAKFFLQGLWLFLVLVLPFDLD
jgi:hypothetical protein